MSGSLQALVGGSGVFVQINNFAVSKSGVGDPQVATITYNRAGTVQNHVPTTLENWANPPSATVGDGYEVQAHVNSGTSPSGSALDTFLALTANRSWSLTQTGGVGFKDCNLTITIRYAGGATIDTATITLHAEML